MDRNKFLEFIGFGYIVNHNPKSKEIHRVRGKVIGRGMRKTCLRNLPSMKYAGYATGFWAWYLITFRGYNGCYYCWRSKDTDR